MSGTYETVSFLPVSLSVGVCRVLYLQYLPRTMLEVINGILFFFFKLLSQFNKFKNLHYVTPNSYTGFPGAKQEDPKSGLWKITPLHDKVHVELALSQEK